MTRTLVLALTLLPFAGGCTTLQPLPDAQPATIRQAIEPGDRVELEKADGTRLSLKVEQVTETELVGVADGKRHTVPLAEVRRVNTRVMTTSDKVWTGVGRPSAVSFFNRAWRAYSAKSLPVPEKIFFTAVVYEERVAGAPARDTAVKKASESQLKKSR